MNCIFCKSAIYEDIIVGRFYCNYCPFGTAFTVSSSFPINKADNSIGDPVYKINAVEFFFYKSEGCYSIQLDYKNKRCNLFNANKLIYSLKYIPKIYPTNANQWLDKFLSLKAFL